MGDLELDNVLEEVVVDEAALSELSDPSEDLTEEILSEDSAEEEIEETEEVEDVEDEEAEDSFEDDEDLI